MFVEGTRKYPAFQKVMFWQILFKRLFSMFFWGRSKFIFWLSEVINTKKFRKQIRQTVIVVGKRVDFLSRFFKFFFLNFRIRFFLCHIQDRKKRFGLLFDNNPNLVVVCLLNSRSLNQWLCYACFPRK